MLVRAATVAVAVAALALAGCAHPAPPKPALRSIPSGAPTTAVVVDETRWALSCTGYACEIDTFELHRGGTASYHYGNGNLYDDARWQLAGGTLVIKVNDGYAIYTAHRSATGFSAGTFTNPVGLHFTFELTPLTGPRPPSPSAGD